MIVKTVFLCNVSIRRNLKFQKVDKGDTTCGHCAKSEKHVNKFDPTTVKTPLQPTLCGSVVKDFGYHACGHEFES